MSDDFQRGLQARVMSDQKKAEDAASVIQGRYPQWIDCWNCGGEGYSDHDCGEDCCVCLYPEDNVVCDICNGEGGWRGIPEADDYF